MISVAVPCYNESSGLAELHRRLTQVCGPFGDYEIVLVNDGSRDTTWAEMQRLAATDPHLVCINLSRNYGHQIALSAGLALCRGDRILILDADLQDPPELLPRMMDLMDQGADVVYGRRATRDGETVFKKTSAYLFYRLLQSLSDQPIPADTGDFRLMSRRVLEALNAMPENHRFVRGMVTWIGFKQVELPYDRAPRHSGVTNYTLRRMARFALDAITSFSIRPLRIGLYCGLIFAAISFLLLVVAVWSYIVNLTVPGWTSVIVIVLFLSAVQFVAMGVIGEYLGRMYIESKRRPLYIIDEVVGGGRL